MSDLTDKVAIITGSARGIGKQIALRLAKAGANVVISDILQDQLDETLTEIHEMSPDSIAIKADVTDKGQVHAMVDQVLEKWGKIDILVNNAGITMDKTFAKMTEEMWDKVLEVNLKGMFFTCKTVLKHMKARAKEAENDTLSHGKIINISSVSADGNFGQANYAASKAGVVGLTKTLAIEYAKYLIQVNAIKPGFIKTPMTDKMPQKVLDYTIKQIPLGHIGYPEDIANAVYYLASDMGNFITGTVLRVDGGMKL